jgi:hypothetical protein
MGAILSVIDDDFKQEKEFGYIDDHCLDMIVDKSTKNDFMCLSFILGYENTIFNSAQMEMIESELEKLYSYFKEKNIIEVLDKIKYAIKFARRNPPSYLLFDGD